jgi:transposase
MDTFPTIPPECLEWRRFRALYLKRRGWYQCDIAEALDVSEEAISRWLAHAREDGPDALRARGSPGRPPGLSPAQRRSIPEFLWHGPEAYGFRGQVWTCARVAKVIQWEFGVRYHKGHVSRLLRGLNWTPQQPIKRAVQRDEQAIRRWRDETWPELRRAARRERRTLILEDESGFYLLPGLVKTYAPKGLTPVIREKQTRDHHSVMGAMTPEGRVYVMARPESFNGLHCIEFLLHLLRVAGDRLLVIWDGSPIHRRVEVKEFVEGTHGRVRLEALPGYAPDLNPWDEGGWNHLKHVELRNVVCRDLEELHQELTLAVGRLRQKPHLVRSFFAQAGLEIKGT